MEQILGRIEEFGPQTGFIPALRMNVALNNKNDFAFDVMSVTARTSISFAEGAQTVVGIPHSYLGEAFLEWGSTTVAPGDASSLTLFLPLDFNLLGGIEGQRAQHDVILNLSIRINGVERKQDGTVGAHVVSATVSDARTPGSMELSRIIAKSQWVSLLRQWQYPEDMKNPLEDLRRTIKEAQQAKQEAEEAARAAKSMSELTAVTALSEAYDGEAKLFDKRSKYWIAISLLLAIIGAVVMYFYATESLIDKFSAPQAIIRAVVILAVFGVFTLCLRIYEAYRHLEVVNRHRVNIGRTFEAFKAAQPTERAREVMSAITADSMLSFGKSGFAGKDSPNQGPMPGATELIKAILESKEHG